MPPPKPAIAADSVKTASVVMRGFMPSVSQAAGLSFKASSRWPNWLRRTATTTSATSANMIAPKTK